MRLVLFGGAVLMTLLASCPGVPPPPPPPVGFDCAAQPAFKRGEVVKVANAIAGQYIVVLKDRQKRIQTLMATEGVQEVQALRQGYAATIAQAALARILKDENVAFVQENGIKRVSPLAAISTRSWGLDRIDQRDLPLDGGYDPRVSGHGVVVAVIDTGLTVSAENMPEFEDRVLPECFTAYPAQGGCADLNSHGTHVSGTIASKTWGVCAGCKILNARVLDRFGSGTDADVIRGVEWVTAWKLAHPEMPMAANISLGGGPSPALDRAVCDMLAAGVATAVAAGNESQDARGSSPARVLQAITVGATDQMDRQANFSNFGPLLDLYGPGVDIESTHPSEGTAVYSGTSMAAPHVAGGAALFLARHPQAVPLEVRDSLVLTSSQDKLSGLGSGSPNMLLYVKAE
jgi:subtilisin family serine protease